jgi:hypothetical protein
MPSTRIAAIMFRPSIGEALHAGTRFEEKALIYSAIWKAFVFGLLVFAFHIIEDMIKHLVHGKISLERFTTYVSTTCWLARSSSFAPSFRSSLPGTAARDGPGYLSGSLFPFNTSPEIESIEQPLMNDRTTRTLHWAASAGQAANFRGRTV